MLQYSDDGSAKSLSSPAQEYLRAIDIVRQYALTSTDTLKLWPPKRYFFSPSHSSVIAYGVENGAAIAMGDPVGVNSEFSDLIGEFLQLCHMQGWTAAFYRARCDLLPLYHSLDFKKLKIGEDAIVELPRFSLSGKSKRDIRSKARQFVAQGVKVVRHDPPLSNSVLVQLQNVSDEWLQIPGRRERGFGVGYFDMDLFKNNTCACGGWC